MAENKETEREVSAEDLRPGMRIVAVTELSYRFGSLDPETLRFVQGVFKGARAEVADEEGERRTVPVNELQPFDHLLGLSEIPSDLMIAHVVPGTAAYMQQRGLQGFKVMEEREGPRETPNTMTAQLGLLRYAFPRTEQVEVGSEEARNLHVIKKQMIDHFLERVSTADADRERYADVIEEMLDQGRGGRYTTKGVESIVQEVISKGSSSAIKAIAGLRGSDQTYAHCIDMSVILQECYADIVQRSGRAPSPANERSYLVAGFMHDIGKSEVPKDILESTERFAPDSREMMLMRNHTTYGARILTEMGMPKTTINVAHYHHVKKDQSLITSYPEVDANEVLPITRLASIVDVYQALIGNRRYKRNWVPGKAVAYLLELRGSEFDERMLDEFLESMGRYPVGSLVRLATGELGFVLMIAPPEHPERPIVAVVENKDGELLTHQTLVDLMLEPDNHVTEVVDHFAHFDESEDQAFRIFTSIQVS